MKIIYVHGKLQDAGERFIAHGCNAQGVMGSGVAAYIRAEHTYAYDEYRRVYEQQGHRLDLGQNVWAPGPKKTIINCITQQNYGRDPNVVYVSYDAVRRCFADINGKVDAVALPLIGAGLANGRWSIISQIIEEEARDFSPVVYLMDGKVPDGVEAPVRSNANVLVI